MARIGKNKRSRPGLGSNQGFVDGDMHRGSDHDKQQPGKWPFEPQHPTSSRVDRNLSEPDLRERSFNSSERRFNLLVDSVPYMVQAIPFRFNGEIRYRISFNGGSEHVFTWDSSLGQLRAIDDEASTLPDNLEEAISEKLQSRS